MKRELRKSSLKWPERNDAVKKARKDRGKYECKNCGSLLKRQNLHLDHINPVVSLQGPKLQNNGEYDWNEYVQRLLCSSDNFQLICEKCHEIKTSLEDGVRTSNKRNKKKKA